MLSFIDIAPDAFGEQPAGDSVPVQAPLPPYTVRVSDRARRARLTVTPRDGLVVVIPRRFPRAEVPGLVETHRDWATRALADVEERRAVFAGGPDAMLPVGVSFPATGERFEVVRVPSASHRVRCVERDGVVRLSGADVADSAACLAALNRWLDRAARVRLVERATRLARLHAFEPAGIRVKRQRTRWGSCTARGVIALNRTLLFLEPELADAVILHELAHTRRLDHSPQFWAELAELDPHAIEHRARLREAAGHVPPWADA